LIYEGLVQEGVAIVKAVRDRYDGAKRNPWDEIELGHHYARAMSSWSLLTAFSGFHYSSPARALRFHPQTKEGLFRCLFVAGKAWGTYGQERTRSGMNIVLRVEEGDLELATLRLPMPGKLVSIDCPFAHVAVEEGDSLRIQFRSAHLLKGGEQLTISAALS